MPRPVDRADRSRPNRNDGSKSEGAPRVRGPDECSDQCLVLSAVAGLGVGIVLLDTRGVVLWLNRTAEDLLGVTSTECVRRPLSQGLRDPQLCMFWQDHADARGRGFADASVRWPRAMELKLNLTDCTTPDGEPLGRALLLCNVTRERMAQVELSRAVADRLLALTNGHMPPEHVANVTPQELRILRLVGRGLGNDEIGKHSAISASTVRSHLKSLYRKLNLRSRAEAVSFAARNHLS